MSKYIYHKGNNKSRKKIGKLVGLGILILGIIISTYIFFPLLSWQIYFAPAFASTIQAPIPKPEIINPSIVGSLIAQAGNIITGVDYTDAHSWFANAPSLNNKPKVSYFSISIPKIKIRNATVTTIGTDLSNSLVNYPGTAIPSDKGTSVVFGHSTLPQLFDHSNYKTIFANAHQLDINDIVFANVNGVTYKYKIFNITIVDPKDTSIFTQDLNDSYLTLVTCTPPGTIWKRLIIKAKIEKL